MMCVAGQALYTGR